MMMNLSPCRTLLALLTCVLVYSGHTPLMARNFDAPGVAPGEGGSLIDPRPTWRQDPRVLFDRNIAVGARHAPHRLMVDTSSALERAHLESSLQTLPCIASARYFHGDISTIRCDEGVELAAIIDALFARRLWSEALFYETSTQDTSLDPEQDYDLDIKQWHHQNKSQNIGGKIGTMGADISSIEAWREVAGDTPGFKIAIIDSGVDFTHPELTPLAWSNAGEVCNNNLDDDGNGFIDDCDGWDFGDDDKDPSPRSLPKDDTLCKRWHGTFIAGLSSAVGDNAEGGSGVHWGVEIINIKKHDDASCTSTTMQSILATRYAVEQGARILQMPFVAAARSAMFEDTLRMASAQGVLLVMSAGNDGSDLDRTPLYPASYDLDAQIVVAYSNNQDRLSPQSNFGATSVDLAAPGEDLYSSDQELDYRIRSGSSYAVPVVAGVASLVWSAFPELSARHVAEAIIEGATPVESLSCSSSPTQCVASGARLDAAGALQSASLKLDGPSLSVERLEVIDFAGDGFLSSGERAQLQYTLYNRGLASSPIAASVEVLDPQNTIAISPSQFTIPPLGSRQRFQATAPLIPSLVVSSSCNRNAEITLILTLRDDLNNLWVRELPIQLACGLDQDQDGVPPPFDCRDDDPNIAPNLPERCDNLDNNCNNQIDEQATLGTTTFYFDQDGDGFGSMTLSVEACTQPTMYVAASGDCDDTNASIGPYTDATGQRQCGLFPSRPAPGTGSGSGQDGCQCQSLSGSSPPFALRAHLWYILSMLTVLLVRILWRPRRHVTVESTSRF